MQKHQQPQRPQPGTCGNRVKKQLTPLEQVNRIDEVFEHALSVKKRTLLEMYGLPLNSATANSSDKKPIVVMGTPVEARDLALSAMVQAHCLLEAIYQGTKLEEPEMGSERKSSTGSTKESPGQIGTPLNKAPNPKVSAVPSASADAKHASVKSGAYGRGAANPPIASRGPPSAANVRSQQPPASPKKGPLRQSSVSTSSPKKTPTPKPRAIPAVPCTQLACIAAPLMKDLSALAQSCGTLERELQQKRKQLEELKAKAKDENVDVQLEDNKGNDESHINPQMLMPRPSDLPLKQRHEVASPAPSSVSSVNVGHAPSVGRVVDTLKKSCLLSASPTPAAAEMRLVVSTDIMSKSMPCGLVSDEKIDGDKAMDEEKRRKRSLQKRWRYVGASVVASAGISKGSSRKTNL